MLHLLAGEVCRRGT